MLRHASLTGGETLTSLRRIYEGDDERDLLLIDMAGSESTMVKRGAGAFTSAEVKIQANVLSELNSRTAIWDEEPMEKLVSQSDFDFADMKALDGKEPFTVYVILPFDQLSTYGSLLRMIVDEFRRAMLRDNRAANIPVVALLDEFPALGKMKSVVDLLGQIAGYGVRFWLIAQSISQLESIYQKTGVTTILETCATKSFFGVAGPETAKWLSEIIGNKTVATAIVSTGGGVSGTDGEGNIQGSINTGESIQLHGVPLVSQQEILTNFGQGSGLQIVFQSGLPPAVGLLHAWYKDPDLRQLGVNLYEQSANGPLVTPNINFPQKMEIYVHGGLFGSHT